MIPELMDFSLFEDEYQDDGMRLDLNRLFLDTAPDKFMMIDLDLEDKGFVKIVRFASKDDNPKSPRLFYSDTKGGKYKAFGSLVMHAEATERRTPDGFPTNHVSLDGNAWRLHVAIDETSTQLPPIVQQGRFDTIRSIVFSQTTAKGLVVRDMRVWDTAIYQIDVPQQGTEMPLPKAF